MDHLLSREISPSTAARHWRSPKVDFPTPVGDDRLLGHVPRANNQRGSRSLFDCPTGRPLHGGVFVWKGYELLAVGDW